MTPLLKLSYLRAMGIDHYVSRAQLPGASPTSRLAIVAAVSTAAESTAAESTAAPQQTVKRHSGAAALLQDTPARPPSTSAKPVAAAVQGGPVKTASAAIKLNLAAIFAGGIAWLESLDGRPLATDQVKLVQAMVRAMGGSPATPKVAQFDWPMHNSRQLDQGGDAARAALSAFLQRHIDEQNCAAIVSLGKEGAEFVDSAQLDAIPRVTTHSTVEMLENPACKQQVWADLQAIVRSE